MNFSARESQVELMTERQIEAMQHYFQKRSEKNEREKFQPAVNKIRELLLWGLFVCLLGEMVYLILQLKLKNQNN